MLSAANLRTRVAVGDDSHPLDALRNTHLWIEYATVGREVHTTDIIGGERGVLQFYPCFAIAELVHNACSIVGKHLIDTDVFGSLSHHR